jgi:diacylglycerol kinase (ATP)
LRRTLLIHNPTAGGGHPPRRELVGRLMAEGLSPTCVSTKNGELETALGEKWDLIIVAGGDGTVSKVGRAIGDADTPFAILPIGTANNVARAVGLNGELDGLIPQLRFATARRLNVGTVRGPWGKLKFFEAVGFGIIAEAISHAGPRPPRALRIDIGREELQTFVRSSKAKRYEVEIDGEEFVGDFLLVEIMNLGFTGPALPISLTAAPDDGLLDVVFLFEKDRLAMNRWLESPEDKPAPVTIRRGRKVTLNWKSGRARIDSRIYLPPDQAVQIRAKLRKRSLLVLVPPNVR